VSRVDALLKFIAQAPQDPFPRYALAMEHKNAGRMPEARAAFESLIAACPDYTASYLHAGNTLVALGDTAAAAAVYRRGIDVCARRGDGHARGEIEGALAALGDETTAR
jgi:tetratricopeptide (TPR) repeat protein